MKKIVSFCVFFTVCIAYTFCLGQNRLVVNPSNQPATSRPDYRSSKTEIPPYYTFLPRNLSREGDYKVVVVPAINPRQARLDAQTYYIGWDALEARMGQSRVMFDVLLKKRKPYVPGTPPITRRIPK